MIICIIIFGDFNANLRNPSETTLLNLCASYGLSQVVKYPTHVTETTTTLLDHIFVSCTRNVSEISVPKFNISDHYPTGISSDSTNVLRKKHTHWGRGTYDV